MSEKNARSRVLVASTDTVPLVGSLRDKAQLMNLLTCHKYLNTCYCHHPSLSTVVPFILKDPLRPSEAAHDLESGAGSLVPLTVLYLFGLVDPAITISPVLTPILPSAEEIYLLNTYVRESSPLAHHSHDHDSSFSMCLPPRLLSYLINRYNSSILIPGWTCLFLYIAPLDAERRPQMFRVSSEPYHSLPQSRNLMDRFRRW